MRITPLMLKLKINKSVHNYHIVEKYKNRRLTAKEVKQATKELLEAKANKRIPRGKVMIEVGLEPYYWYPTFRQSGAIKEYPGWLTPQEAKDFKADLLRAKANPRSKKISKGRLRIEAGVSLYDWEKWNTAGKLPPHRGYFTIQEADEYIQLLKDLKTSTFKVRDIAKATGVNPNLAYRVLLKAGLIKQGFHSYPREKKQEFIDCINNRGDIFISPAEATRRKHLAKGEFSVVEAAKRLGMPHIMLTSWINKNHVPKPPHRVGVYHYYHQADLDEIRKIKKDYFQKKEAA